MKGGYLKATPTEGRTCARTAEPERSDVRRERVHELHGKGDAAGETPGPESQYPSSWQIEMIAEAVKRELD